MKYRTFRNEFVTRTRPVKGTIVTGAHKGLSFVLFGVKHALENGFSYKKIRENITGGIKTHLGCVFTEATQEEINALPTSIPKEIQGKLAGISGRAKYKFVGTSVLTGEKITFVGSKEMIRADFNPAKIYKAVQTKTKIYEGYTWERFELS